MANGEGPSDLDDFVLRSGVRSGLKREFAFALKAQASLPVALGRTRSGKALASPAVAASPRVSKRPRKSSGGDLTPSPAVFLDLPRPGSNAVTAQVPVGIDCKAEAASVADDDELKGEVATDAPAPMKVDYKSTMADAVLALEVVKPIKVFVRSLSTGRHEGLVTSPPRPINLTGIPVEAANACSDDGVGLPHKGNATDNSDMVVDSIDSINVVRLLSGSEMPPNMLGEVAVVSLPPQATVDDTSTLDESTVASPPQQAAVHLIPSVLGSSQSVGSRDGPKYFRRFASPLKVSTTVGTMDFTSNSATKENICVIHKDNDSQQLERPPRRFTRSLLKVEAEDSGSVDGSNANSKSSGSEETKGTINVVNATLSSTPKKKMELKMSKKIALTKLPANSRELIATGLLEGLHVQYVNVNGKLSQLQGVIKDNGILCSCSSCNGSVVVSTYVFEQHAGSTKKHPADFIYLDNGKNLRDVVKACTSAPLDMLEAVIQGAVGLQPPDKSSLCQKCQASFYASGDGNSACLCDKCLELKQTPKTPGPINVNASATRLSRANTISVSSNGSSKNISSNKKASIGKLTRKDLGLHKLVFMNDILPEGTEVGYYVRGKRLREGYIKDSGICCLCCNTVVSPSQFEAHAGQASRRKPYNNIYTSNGVSLHELSVSLSKDRKLSTSENDDLCSICADGGNLLLCDLCPRAFHKECVGLPSIPKEDWYCQYCTNLHQRERSVACNDNAIAAGRVAGVDPIEQIFKRCIRMVTTEFDIGSCTLCRLHDFSKSGFDDRTVMICDQCEKEYHVGCLRDNKMADLKELPEEEWFCCDDCKRIRISLQELLQRGPESPLPINANLIKKCESNGMNENANVDITWRILSGKTAEEEIKLLLSRAVAIFHESFDPIVDAATGRDLIPSMVYGRTVRDQDYGGMYCAILTVGATVVSAGILRVLGSEVAELPLVATSREHQGKGYFQSLFACIERLLASLKIKHFVLPAADEAESIWTKKFGFSKVTSEQLEEILNGVRTTVFQGTSMLHKPVPVAITSCQADQTADVAIASCQAEQPADVESIVSCQREPIVHEELIIACQGETVAHVESIISCQGVGHEKAIISCQGETVAHEELNFSFEGEPTADVDDMVSFQQERAGEERPIVPCEGVH